jgi:(p)ppGpp synthase/HD superfamily hydrolase
MDSDYPVIQICGYPLANKASEFAHKKHETQFRRSGEHYYNHCNRVASMVEIHSQDDELVATAYLHDCLEDTETTFEELLNEFGQRVANLVLSLTNDKKEMEKLGKTEYLARKVLGLSMDALLIKLCDRIDNISDLRGPQDEWSSKYAQQTKYVFIDQLYNRGLPQRLFFLLEQIREKLVGY